MSLSKNKAAGPDEVTNEMLVVLLDTIIDQIIDLFNKWLKEGSIDEEIIEGIVAMLYKNGDRNKTKNQRPITLLNTLQKLFQKIMKERMQE